jgi:methyl-accepting chemotaxis protein
MDALASSVSETSSTIEQLTVTTDQVAKNMETLASTVVETSSTVEQMTVSLNRLPEH